TEPRIQEDGRATEGDLPAVHPEPLQAHPARSSTAIRGRRLGAVGQAGQQTLAPVGRRCRQSGREPDPEEVPTRNALRKDGMDEAHGPLLVTGARLPPWNW